MPSASTSLEGGHRVQLNKTGEALANLGVEVDVAFSQNVSLDRADVVHGFGISAPEIRRARVAGLPVVMSTIYWSRDYVAGLVDEAARSRLERAARLTASYLRRGPLETAARVLEVPIEQMLRYESADLLFPNSQLEAATIRRELGVSTPTRVVPNAVDDELFTPGTQTRSGVLCAARIEPHKNQLGLIRAISGSGIPLTIAGSSHPDHARYYAACRAAADASVRFVPHTEHHELRDLYRGAAVHVLASGFETTGLSSLEAALCGCAVVTTSRGYVREYFGDLAYYCEPNDPGSIRKAVEEALIRPLPALRARVLANFTWRHAAEATRAGYEEVLARR